VNSVNCYEDANRASAYATLEFANTYYLAFRDLPEILSVHVTGLRELDLGCRTGRSTRVLRKLGLDVTGVNISEDMLRIARTIDPSGNYLVRDDNLDQFAAGAFDLVLCAFPFDNIPGAMKARIFRDLRRLLAPNGMIVNLVSAPDLRLRMGFFHRQGFPRKRASAQRSMSCASWSLITKIGGLSRTSSGPTNRIERYIGKRVSKRFTCSSL
jgi:SAM-dependent methyltransferase